MHSDRNNVSWLPKPNKVELYFSDKVPYPEKVAAVFVYAFNEKGTLLMIQEPKGTWDIPGGGREQGESIEQTAIRETLEEASVKIKDIKMVAYQKLIVSGEKPKDYRRPYPEAYEVFVTANVDKELPFEPSSESVDRKYFPIKEAVQQEGIQFENRHVIFESCIMRNSKLTNI